MTDLKAQYPSARQANFALAILVLAYVFSLLDRNMLSLMVGPIRQNLGISDFQMSLIQGTAFAVWPIAPIARRSFLPASPCGV